MIPLIQTPDSLGFNGGDARTKPIHVAVWGLHEDVFKDGYLFKSRDASVGSDILKSWCDLFSYGKFHGFIFLTFDQVVCWENIDAILLWDRMLYRNTLSSLSLP